MDLTERDFDTVLIAEGGFGPVDRAIAKKDLFHCTECSTSKHMVFHNVHGTRPHIGEQELTKRIDAAMWNLF